MTDSAGDIIPFSIILIFASLGIKPIFILHPVHPALLAVSFNGVRLTITDGTKKIRG